MKKIILSLVASFSAISYAQIKTNQDVIQGAINSQTAFIDVSSYKSWNDTTNIGKGFVFPRTDLTKLTTLVATPNGIATSYPNRLDGMIVYNVGDGAPGINPVATPKVTPGFYYYENKTNNLQGGKWVRIGDGSANASSTLEIGNAEVATGIKIDNKELYTIKGTFVSDGSPSARIEFPAGMSALYSIKIYKRTGSSAPLLVHTQLYEYKLGTNAPERNVVFGSGILSTSIQSGTYDYVLEYFK